METERLIIREMVPEDVDALYEIYEAPSVTKYMENLFEEKEEEYQYMRNYYDHVYCFFGYGMWLLTLKNGTVIGRAGIENNDRDEIVLGYVVGEAYQRQGYAYEACKAILGYARNDLEIEDVVVYVHPENEPSIRLAEKLGVRVRFLENTNEEKNEKCKI